MFLGNTNLSPNRLKNSQCKDLGYFAMLMVVSYHMVQVVQVVILNLVVQVAQSMGVQIFEMPTDKANDVFIRVFLSSEMRTRFKVACAQAEVAMSEKARELIEEWTMKQEVQNKSPKTSDSKGDK